MVYLNALSTSISSPLNSVLPISTLASPQVPPPAFCPHSRTLANVCSHQPLSGALIFPVPYCVDIDTAHNSRPPLIPAVNSTCFCPWPSRGEGETKAHNGLWAADVFILRLRLLFCRCFHAGGSTATFSFILRNQLRKWLLWFLNLWVINNFTVFNN